MTFSPKYATYTAWLRARPRTSTYAKVIIRRHKIAPRATLQVLRARSPVQISHLTWDALTAPQRVLRRQSLDALKLLRQGQPFSTVAKQVNLAPRTLREQLGNALIKRGGRWMARRTDTIERALRLYENGKLSTIVVTNSKDASLIGEYFSAVRKALRTGDSQPLQKFKHLTITDASGNTRRFETNIKKLYEIEERKENSEFFDIYDE